MIENLVGKTSCYDICPIGHDCFGGYLTEEPLCDGEFKRVEKALAAESGVSQVLFAPNNKGPQILYVRDNQVQKLRISEGQITEG